MLGLMPDPPNDDRMKGALLVAATLVASVSRIVHRFFCYPSPACKEALQ
jgi:hypothetical protein